MFVMFVGQPYRLRPLDAEQCYLQLSVLTKHHNLKYDRVSMAVLLKLQNSFNQNTMTILEIPEEED